MLHRIVVRSFQSILGVALCGSWMLVSCGGGGSPNPPAPPALQSISVSPQSTTVAAGLTQQYTATGNYSDGTSKAISSVTWSTSDGTLAKVSFTGLVSAVKQGSVTVSATSGTTTGSTPLTVSPGNLLSVSVSPQNPIVSTGQTQQFTATGTYTDGSTHDLTLSSAWSSGTATVAKIANTGLATTLTAGTSTIQATSGSISGSTTLTVTAPVLQAIAVTPANPTVTISGSLQFTATGSYSDGSTQNVTGSVAWNSTAPAVATISSSGVLSGVSVGQTTISATSGAIHGGTIVNIGGEFATTGSLNNARLQDTATLLNNGMVLITGGNYFKSTTGYALASAELYNPSTGGFAPTGSLNNARYNHTATLLTNGMVLIVGGTYYNPTNGGLVPNAEIYDPATGIFTSTGSLNTPRYNHTATLLSNGKVLVAGGTIGNSGGGYLASAELFDPASGTFTPTGSLNTARNQHTATPLSDGMVLVAGGYNQLDIALTSAELYNPATDTFTPTGSLNNARYVHTATLLDNGMVLITAGYNNCCYLANAELFNPATGTFVPTGSLNTARAYPTATLLNNGMVLVAGGTTLNTTQTDPVISLTSAELYDPVTGMFTPTDSLSTARGLLTATLLNNGTVLFAGGVEYIPSTNLGTVLASAELYSPATLAPLNLVSITVTPATAILTLGKTQEFIATGTFRDGSTEQLASVTWSSSHTSIASITNDVTNLGAAYGVAVGSSTIQACTGTVCGSAVLTVNP